MSVLCITGTVAISGPSIFDVSTIEVVTHQVMVYMQPLNQE